MKNGFLIINKPKGISSHDAIRKIRAILKTRKVGHAGTLDPFATGILFVAVNKGTRFIEFFDNSNKTYLVKGKLGIITDTFDITGEIKEKYDVLDSHKNNLEEIVYSFIGEYLQIPPAYSAKKYKGKKLYEYARKGEIINLPPKKQYIYDIKNFNQKEDEFEFIVEVSSGTYIRSLIMDIGYKLGCGATAIELKRTGFDYININESIEIDEISYDKVIPVENVLKLPSIWINNPQKIINGIQVYKTSINKYDNFEKNEYIKILDEKSNFVGIGKTEKTSKFLQTLLSKDDRNDRIVKLYKILG